MSKFDSVASLGFLNSLALPPQGGILPYWLLLTSAASVYNAAQNYFVLWQTREIYSGKADQVTPLAARLFAAWTGITAIIRGVAAYHLADPTIYTLAQATFLVALWHFSSELLIFRTVRLNRASIAPLIVASTSLVWTTTQRGYYVQ